MRTQGLHNSLRESEQEEEKIQADEEQIKTSPFTAAYTAVTRYVRTWTSKHHSALLTFPKLSKQICIASLLASQKVT